MERKAVYLVWQPRGRNHFIVTLNPWSESIILLSFFPSKRTGQTFMCVCMCVYVHVHERTCMHMCMYMCTCVHMHVGGMHVHIHVCLYVYVSVSAHLLLQTTTPSRCSYVYLSLKEIKRIKVQITGPHHRARP